MVEQLPTVLAVGVFAACFLRYRQRWFMPGHEDYLLEVHRTVAAGTGIAPNQYRPLMPVLAHAISSLGVTLPHAVLALDGLLLVAAVLALRAVLRDVGAEHLLLAGAVAFAFWFTKLDHWSPETMLLVAVVAVVVRELQRAEPRWWVVGVCGFVMLGARTDYAATLGVTLLAVAWTRRSAGVAILGVGLLGGAGMATELWKHLYPQAHYVVDVVQLPYNLTPGSWEFVLAYYGTVLLCPTLLALRTRRLPPLWPAVVWFGAEFGAVFVVGRVEESRLFMPFAAVLGVAAVLAYLELRRSDTDTIAERRVRPEPEIG